jgi:23S rRNA pseudouridine1911/1915/1917 synthase
VLGDPVYSGERKGFPELAGQCLHARKLSFIHPRTGERLTLACPLPDYFTATLARCAKMQ